MVGSVVAGLGGISPVGATGPESEPGSGLVVWSPPVNAPVVESFESPASRYGPGHRGVDYAVPAGTPIRAAGDGVVVFAGTVAGTLHVTVLHAGGLRTSYSFLASVRVRRGETVRRGQVLGSSGGGGSHGHGGTVHLGLRAGDRYLDPLLLFQPIDLADVVRLVPVKEQFDPVVEESKERKGFTDLVGGALGVPGWLADKGTSAVRGVVNGIEDGAAAIENGLLTLGRTASELASDLAQLGIKLAPAVIDALWEAGQFALRLSWDYIDVLGQKVPQLKYIAAAYLGAQVLYSATNDWWDQRTTCSSKGDVAKRPVKGSGHLLMRVGGLGSSSEHASILKLPTEELGYQKGEVFTYSYKKDSQSYEAKDTYGDIENAAKLLAHQLRAIARENPGREVDLVGHSQGGLVIRRFLEEFYSAADPSFPPLGQVASLATPHQGSPIATVGWQMRGTVTGKVALEFQGKIIPGMPPAGSPAVQQLREGSPLIEDLNNTELPDQIDFITLGGTADIVVPAEKSRFDGSRHGVVSPRGLNDHDAITRDQRTVASLGLALEGRPLPCTSFMMFLKTAAISKATTELEHEVGDNAELILGEMDRTVGLRPTAGVP